jgi:hypothetical protein
MTGASLARAARWPLWSWRNLVVSAIAVLALLAGVGRLTDVLSADSSPSSNAVGASSAPTVPVASPSATGSPTGLATTAPPTTASSTTTGASKGSPVEVATALVTAWATPGEGESQWLAGMKPWATADLVASMTGTDPTQVPATKVTGDAALRGMKARTATVSVPTDGGRVAVELVQQSGAWKADSLAPDDAPPGAPTPALGASTTASAG